MTEGFGTHFWAFLVRINVQVRCNRYYCDSGYNISAMVNTQGRLTSHLSYRVRGVLESGVWQIGPGKRRVSRRGALEMLEQEHRML